MIEVCWFQQPLMWVGTFLQSHVKLWQNMVKGETSTFNESELSWWGHLCPGNCWAFIHDFKNLPTTIKSRHPFWQDPMQVFVLCLQIALQKLGRKSCEREHHRHDSRAIFPCTCPSTGSLKPLARPPATTSRTPRPRSSPVVMFSLSDDDRVDQSDEEGGENPHHPHVSGW